MSPIESMSAGKPVLGVDEGGLKETIIHQKTGYLIESSCKEEDIIKAVAYLTVEKCISMREDCKKRADEFSLVTFEKKLRDIVYQ
jgi:glycosyltransferase involved in cell wall biosynthesis